MAKNSQQLSLFDDQNEEEDEDIQAHVPELELHASTPLGLAVQVYIRWLEAQNLSVYTVRAFRSDINLFKRWAGEDRPVGDFGTSNLNDFLGWMVNERNKPCSPKTYSRRVTTLKNFFGYLQAEGVIKTDPANAVIQRTVQSPLPNVPSEEQVEQMLRTAQAIRTDGEKPDARPYLLTALLLQTGIKKSECMSLKPHDFIREGYNAPAVWVHYEDPKQRYKERTLSIDEELLTALDEYLMQRKPEEVVFDCTARNLEYVLRDLAERANVPHSLISFETLRWINALRGYGEGIDAEEQRIKLGLTSVSYSQTRKKLTKLAYRMGYTVHEEDDQADIKN